MAFSYSHFERFRSAEPEYAAADGKKQPLTVLTPAARALPIMVGLLFAGLTVFQLIGELKFGGLVVFSAIGAAMALAYAGLLKNSHSVRIAVASGEADALWSSDL